MTWAQRRAIVICVLILFLILIVWVVSKPRRLPSKGVLVMDAEGQIDEQSSPGFLGALTGDSTPVLHDYLDAIDSARSDSRITGLVVRIAPLATGWENSRRFARI